MKITVVGMIYKSIDYLNFMLRGIYKYCKSFDGYEVNYLIVANDPTEKVITSLNKLGVKWVLYKDKNPKDYYLNRVYRAWNYGGNIVNSDIVVFINSDMGFSSGWLKNLIRELNSDTIPCSRLVESGKMPSGLYGISRNFGKHPSQYNEIGFLNFVKSIAQSTVMRGGLYMPCAFYTKDFADSGGYPEGNVGRMSGDKYFFTQNSVMGIKKHITVFDSLVYHFQEGEMDD